MGMYEREGKKKGMRKLDRIELVKERKKREGGLLELKRERGEKRGAEGTGDKKGNGHIEGGRR